MKISLFNSSQNNISFEKKLVAKTNVLSGDNLQRAFIYKLDRVSDKDYFKKVLANEENSWKDGFLIYSASNDMIVNNDDFYVLEDSEENCLGFIISRDYTDEFNRTHTTVRKLETAPIYSSRNKDRKIKNIGKALIDFMKKVKCEKNGNTLFISSPFLSALEFYEKQGFEGDLKGCFLKHLKVEEQTKMNFVE